MGDLWVEMDKTVFREKFFPGEVDIPTSQNELLQNLPEVMFETPGINTNLNSHLITAFQPALGDEYVLRDTNHPSLNTEGTRIFDLAVYKRRALDDPETSCHEITESERASSKAKSERVPHLAKCCPRHVVVPFEIKMAQDNNPFGKAAEQPLLSVSENGILSRGQIAEQAGFTQRFQHRTFLFGVQIYRKMARIIRWDRAGAIITKPFDYTKEPEILLRFLLRISIATDEELGYDPTVAPADKAKISELKQYASDCPKHLKGLFKKAFLDHLSFIQQVTIRDRIFLIGELHYGTWSATGRGTKGYIAYDVAEKNLCYIKDSWRNPRGHAEHETYEILRKAQVQNIATCIVGEDVTGPGQVTTTQDHLSNKTFRDLSNRVHYRVALREIGLPLSQYKNSGQLCKVVYDAFNAHSQAWEAGVLHRDISDSNIRIIIRDDGTTQGLLLDWDLCKYKDELANGATAISRSGTWAFTSAMRLQYPLQKGHTLSDDLESFFHLITFLTFRFHYTALSGSETFSRTIQSMYYLYETNESGLAIGGGDKLKLMEGNRFAEIRSRHSPGLTKLIFDLLALCHRHYVAMEPQRDAWDEENAEVRLRQFKLKLANQGYDAEPDPREDSEEVAPINLNNQELVLDSHKEMHDILYRAVHSASQGASRDWPEKDRTPVDQLPERLRKAIANSSMESIKANNPERQAESGSGSGR